MKIRCTFHNCVRSRHGGLGLYVNYYLHRSYARFEIESIAKPSVKRTPAVITANLYLFFWCLSTTINWDKVEIID